MFDSSGRLTLVPPHPLRAMFRRPPTYILLLLGIAGLLTSAWGTDPTLRLVTGAYALAVAWILAVLMVRTAGFGFDLTPDEQPATIIFILRPH